MQETNEKTNKGVFEGSENTPILANRIKEGGAIISTSSSVFDGGGTPTRRADEAEKRAKRQTERDANKGGEDFRRYIKLLALLAIFQSEGRLIDEESKTMKAAIMERYKVDSDWMLNRRVADPPGSKKQGGQENG
jgi:hypothetical protein